jgi:hypothetical protein
MTDRPRPRSGYRVYRHKPTGEELDFHTRELLPDGTPRPGFRGQSHWHRHNAKSISDSDRYLDASDRPVPDGTRASCLVPREQKGGTPAFPPREPDAVPTAIYERVVAHVAERTRDEMHDARLLRFEVVPNRPIVVIVCSHFRDAADGTEEHVESTFRFTEAATVETDGQAGPLNEEGPSSWRSTRVHGINVEPASDGFRIQLIGIEEWYVELVARGMEYSERLLEH